MRAIAIHPQNPQVIYIGTQHGPYRSTDGGDHWEKLGFPDLGMVVWSILFDPKNPQTMYLGTAPQQCIAATMVVIPGVGCPMPNSLNGCRWALPHALDSHGG